MALCPFANAVAITTATFTALTEQPAEWATKYNEYYVKNSAGLYIAVQGTESSGSVVAPEFVSGKFYSKS